MILLLAIAPSAAAMSANQLYETEIEVVNEAEEMSEKQVVIRLAKKDTSKPRELKSQKVRPRVNLESNFNNSHTPYNYPVRKHVLFMQFLI
ncbi:MAG: hypothetical protein KI790_07870 [Cyclobacteriaceae bacterium]|nr:hypothetical protein [Cyclobacteriaceae bacterium HetDA_MAG_MS6]